MAEFDIILTLREQSLSASLSSTSISASVNLAGPRGPQGIPGDPASNLVTSVNTQTGAVVLDTDDIADTATNRYTNDTDIARLADTSGENTGDQDLSGLATDSELTAGLATKEPTITAGTTSQYYRGDKTWQTLNTTAVGIPNVDNTSDMDKPVSTAQGVALNLKEDLSNKSTTTTLGVSNTLYPTQNAVKTYVDTQNALYVLKAGDDMTGDLVTSGAKLRVTNPGSGAIESISLESSGAFAASRPIISFKSTPGNVTMAEIGASAGSGYTSSLFRIRTADSSKNLQDRFAIDVTGLVGLGTTAPTHTLTLPSTATGIALYNTVDQTTNYERVRQYWAGSTFNILNEIGGTGSPRAIRIGVYSGGLYVRDSSSLSQGFVSANQGSVSGNQSIFSVNGSLTASSNVQAANVIAPTINQSGTAGYTAILANVTETSTGSGAKNLIDLQVGGSSRFSVNNAGSITNNGNINIGGSANISGNIDMQSGRISLVNGGSATAIFDLGAANTSRASMRIRTGVAPTSPNDGDIWYDGTELKMRMAGVTQTVAPIGGGSGITRSIVTTSGNVTAGATASTDYVYIIAGAHTVTLPTAVGNTNKYDLNNASGSPIALAFTSGQTANGGGVTLGANESITLISDGADWRIL